MTAVLLVLSAPVQLVVALVVKGTMGSPVLFRQQRPGKDEVPFTMVKFRTMKVCANSQNGAADDASRMTSVGAFLRATSLDELPTLWNVLMGHMSLVGPRPLLMEYLPRYTAEQRRRHEVRPGVTGLAQVNGRNAITWEQKFALDAQYVATRSLRLDLRILVQTAGRVLKRSDIAAPGSVTMPEFMGSNRG